MTDIFTYYLAAGLVSVFWLTLVGWFDTKVDVWLLVRMFATVALWPVPVAMYVQEKWQKASDW
jgi:hypothetical protein